MNEDADWMKVPSVASGWVYRCVTPFVTPTSRLGAGQPVTREMLGFSKYRK